MTEYVEEMIKLTDKEYYNKMSDRVREKYHEFYEYTIVEKKLLEIVQD